MYLFYTPELNGNTFALNEEESRHCVNVLRLRSGDTIHITDGIGNLYETIITEANPKRCTGEIVTILKEYPYHDEVGIDDQDIQFYC